MLIPNSIKVKEILKEQSLELDATENEYLFGDKFEEKLSKITTAKQKPKTIFTGLLNSSSSKFRPCYQPFRAGPLSQNKQKEYQGVKGAYGRYSKEQLLEEVRAIPAKLHQKTEIISSNTPFFFISNSFLTYNPKNRLSFSKKLPPKIV